MLLKRRGKGIPNPPFSGYLPCCKGGPIQLDTLPVESACVAMPTFTPRYGPKVPRGRGRQNRYVPSLCAEAVFSVTVNVSMTVPPVVGVESESAYSSKVTTEPLTAAAISSPSTIPFQHILPETLGRSLVNRPVRGSLNWGIRTQSVRIVEPAAAAAILWPVVNMSCASRLIF